MLLLLACHSGGTDDTDAWQSDFTALEEARIRQMGPVGEPPPDPTNRWAEDPDAARLGQWIFYDTRFSQDGTVACVTCHDPTKGFADDLALAEGLEITDRSAPTIWNTAFGRWMFWDGRADSHWSQALGPMESPVEHGGNRNAFAHLIYGDPDLKAAYEALFGAMPDLSDTARFPPNARPISEAPDHPHNLAWDAMAPEDQLEITGIFVNVGKSIAAYERLLITPRAPIDDFVDALESQDQDGMDSALGTEAQQGLRIFVGVGQCHFCHAGPRMSDLEFHHLGLGPRTWLTELDVGRFDGSALVMEGEFNGLSQWSDDPEAGGIKLNYLVVSSSEQIAAFKTPGLRNIAQTAPYMHGGHFEDLEGVIQQYNTLEEESAVAGSHRDELLVELELTDSEVQALVTFLEEGLSSTEELDAALLGPPDSPGR